MIKRIFFLLAAVLGLMAFASTCTTMPVRVLARDPFTKGEILFQDDFTNAGSGWDTWSDANGSLVTYQEGGLRIFINELKFDFWSRPGKRFVDSAIEVDATTLAGPDDNDYGILCRFKDKDNYYALLISSDGYYGVLKSKDGKDQLLNGGSMKPNQSILRGKATNHLRAECTGERLVFYANGKKLVEIEDSEYSSGEVGLIAGTYTTPGVDILFDNFVVYNP
jgi:hypothetical protein